MSAALSPWSGLASVAGRVDLWALIGALGGPPAAARASPGAWAAAGLPLELLPLLQAPGVDCGGVALHPGAPEWPRALEGQPFAPVLLGAEGNTALLARPAVAVVGARACTAYGLRHAGAIARAVASAGGVVVSGLARGIDREAHLAAPGATIAVLGHGLEAPMPAWQAALRRRVLEDGGLVLSEHPRRLPPDRWTFPVRNRIVAGLARATVVVEAAHASGARNTAAHALRLGADVLAVPGPIDAPASAGCLDLIEQGAGVVRGPSTVLAAAGLQAAPEAHTPGSSREDRVFAALGAGASADSVGVRLALPHAEVSAALVVLELTGRVRRLPGGQYAPRST